MNSEKDIIVYLKMQISEYAKMTSKENFSYEEGFKNGTTRDKEHDKYISIKAIRNAIDYAWIGVDIETKNRLDEVERKHEVIKRFFK